MTNTVLKHKEAISSALESGGVCISELLSFPLNFFSIIITFIFNSCSIQALAIDMELKHVVNVDSDSVECLV